MFEEILFNKGLSEAVHAMLRSGFYRLDEIEEFFYDIAEDDPESGLNPSTVTKEVKGFHAIHLESLLDESRTWERPTDNEKLEAAFDDLNKHGIRSIQNYRFEASDCGELYAEIRGDAQWSGYCFYHNQDLVRAVCHGDLMIRFSESKDNPTEEGNKRIAKEIIRTMNTHGLSPEWDGDPERTIGLTLSWKAIPQDLKSPPEPTKQNSKPWWKLW
jgi:hypothetical protein